ncbi:DUF7269 family protein [Haloarchaeobius sp. HRN-SO-5]|uniref:DUF7269 family protein n=1 Tax=Haloarchaeobius sp. HRN-SO-5 TaxID=3446118 RepID=UPI003EC0E0F3
MTSRPNPRRLLLGLFGLAVVTVVVARVGLVSTLPVDAAVDVLGNDYLLVVAFAAGALLLAALAMLSGRPGSQVEATTPDPERAVSLPVPGDEFDAAMSSRLALVPLVGSSDRGFVRQRLRRAAVFWVMRSDNCTRAEADQRVATGDWTDDRDAALFLADDVGTGARLWAVFRSWVRLRPWTQLGARRTATVLVESANGGETR